MGLCIVLTVVYNITEEHVVSRKEQGQQLK